ncbi:hypothetical protein GOP47_0022238 [Adiantum capillus-veneris]|uniref:Uncharacterized protein n=1 Tax=Adiantum capillus-veneris TaxID=13818 RepID=A0A9D4UAY8_ADICA|nr:hypothetical protein GOP47_0022238 [Adiantum capillus-veneris]
MYYRQYAFCISYKSANECMYYVPHMLTMPTIVLYACNLCLVLSRQVSAVKKRLLDWLSMKRKPTQVVTFVMWCFGLKNCNETNVYTWCFSSAMNGVYFHFK